MPRKNLKHKQKKTGFRVIVTKVRGVGSHPLIGAPRGTILVSRKLKKYKKPIILHEKVEHYYMKRGTSYRRAHKIADRVERRVYFRGRPKAWKEYMKKVRANGRE